MNFATFYSQAIKDKTKKAKKGRYKGQSKKTKEFHPNGPAYHQPFTTDAPSASTYTVRG